MPDQKGIDLRVSRIRRSVRPETSLAMNLSIIIVFTKEDERNLKEPNGFWTGTGINYCASLFICLYEITLSMHCFCEKRFLRA
jgi:hypothetical protein